MDQCTHEVRLQYWKNIISQCQCRPAGQTAKQWMKENGICEQTYYVWQRKIRRETFEQISSVPELPAAMTGKEEIAFAEIPLATTDTVHQSHSAEQGIHPVAVLKTESFSIALSGDIPDILLARILKEVSHA